MNMKMKSLWLIMGALWLSAASGSAYGQAYQIGPGDVLEIRFWQDRTLDQVVKVRQDGMISLDIAGEIEAAGQTTQELERRIIRQISRFNSAISQTVVRVVEYNYLHVFVSGQARTPGKYSFEKIPDLWTIINEAGGATDLGDLSRIMIIRGGADSGKVEVVNVSALVTSGKRDELPTIRPGDTIEIPATPSGLPARSLADQTGLKNVFYVTGEILRPGPLTLEKNIDLMDALAMAGGPTQFADLKKVVIISKDGASSQVMQYNLKKYQGSGAPGRYFLRPEDTIVLNRKRGGFLGIDSVTGWLGVLAGAGSVALVAYQLHIFGWGEESNP